MASDEVFVDRFSGVVVRSSVEIERQEDGSYSVLWDDGTTSTVERRLPQRITRFVKGSVKHRAVVEPEKLESEFRTTPELVFTAILRENRGPMRSQELTAAAIAAGLDGATVRAAWPKVRQGWQRNPNVRPAGNPPSFTWVESTSVTSEQLSGLPTMDLLHQLAGKPGDEQARSTVRTRVREQDLPERLAAAALRIVPWPTPAEVAERLREPRGTGASLTALGDDLLTRIVQAALAERRRDLLWLLATDTRAAGPLARLGDVLRTDPDADTVLTRTLGLLEDDLLGADPGTGTAVAEQIATVVTRIGPVATRPEPVAVLLALLQLAPEDSPTLTEAVLRLLPRLEPRVVGAAAERDDPAEILAAAAAVPLIPGSGRSTLLAVAARSDLPGLTAPKTWAGVEIAHLVRMLEAGELADVLARADVGAAVVAPLAEASVREATDRRRLAAVLTWPSELLDHVDTRVLARALTAIAASDGTMRRLVDDLIDLGTA